ncbi:hypothetical protein RN001_014490 [Aquatica leii]|uniref:RING-type domain-containing protein n=1 Tax=Aquatica leii TaxID=1421715 RepID=A0AAN7S682_9COLE|nr:hypothetical protein RN001_014490 [Aquatica leii]
MISSNRTPLVYSADIPLEVNEQPEQTELLAPLDGDVPAEYQTPAPGGNDEDSGDKETNPAEAVPLVPYPQLGLDYTFSTIKFNFCLLEDSAGEEVFHLPEDVYEEVPLKAFENAGQEVQPQIPNPFIGSGYDDDIDDTLSEEEACFICRGRRKKYVLINCGHLLCGYCATHSYNPLNDVVSNKCLICTTVILKEPIKIFF